jgi:Protein of unknown function (DUF3800)
MSFGSVVDFLTLERSRQGVLLVPVSVIHAVFDESGKFHDHNVISLCGWIARLEHWEMFAQDWQRILDRFGLKELHAAEFMDLHGQYFELRNKWGDDKDAKKYDALSAFVDTIKKHVSEGIGAIVDAKYFRSMPDKSRQKIGEEPYFLAFQEVLLQAMKHVEAFAKKSGLGENVSLGLIFDQEEKQAEECLRLLNRIKKTRKDIRDRVSGICFSDRRKYNPLQAADFLAHQTKLELERRIHTPNHVISPWFASLSSRNQQFIPDGLFNGRIFDAECLEEIAAK